MLENVPNEALYGAVPVVATLVVQFLKKLQPLKGLLDSKEAKVVASIAVSVAMAYFLGMPPATGLLMGLAGSGVYDLKGVLKK